MPKITSRNPRDILNEIKWRALDTSRCEVFYIHRGAPNDTKVVRGDEINEIGPSFFILRGGTMIPYHRIFRIAYEGKVVYDRVNR
ncbi:MAG: DUF504 domain-containing protein [Methanocellales archaeon]|nr:DUF504 domain-containing protein [Methanocellales archaeon]